MATGSKGMLWTGRVMSALPVLMFLMGGAMALSGQKQAVEGFKNYGFPDGSLQIIGVLEITCAIIYAIPQTAVLGAILLTGYLGGAVATHVRASENSWPFAVAFGVLVWGGLFLRDPRIRAMIPFRR